MPWLIVLDGALAGRRFPLDATFLVGRGPYNHAVLDDVRISRQHAKISPESGGHVLYDLNSANGTFVNDEPAEKRTLEPGDVLRVGPFRFRFESDTETDVRLGRVHARTPRVEELTRRGFEAPTRIVGAVDANVGVRPGLADLEDADRKLRKLYSFVHAISTTLDATQLLDLIASNLLDVFVGAEAAQVFMLDPQTEAMEPRRFVQRGADHAPGALELLPLPRDLHQEIVQKGKATLSAPMSLSFEEDGPPSGGILMHAPMLSRGQVIGVLNVRCGSDAYFTENDLDLFMALAAHAALVLQNAKLHEESLTREKLAQDLIFAEQVQKSFLPTELPDVAGIAFVADYEPAYAVGGDFYDVFWQSPERIGIVLGDVSGKGVTAALLMARVSSDIRAAMLRDFSPRSALSEVNRGFLSRGQHDKFVTAICLTLDVRRRRLTFANAGHLPPYVVNSRSRQISRIDAATSPPLGLFEDLVFEETELALEPDDTLFLCTDGVLEATSEQGIQFGFEGLERTLALGSSNPQEICDRVLAAVRAHVGAAPQYDDLTLVLCGVS